MRRAGLHRRVGPHAVLIEGEIQRNEAFGYDGPAADGHDDPRMRGLARAHAKGTHSSRARSTTVTPALATMRMAGSSSAGNVATTPDPRSGP
ncbi:MAG: hypothetical protein ACYCXX_10440 [Acidiferrobacter thiooxydans]